MIPYNMLFLFFVDKITAKRRIVKEKDAFIWQIRQKDLLLHRKRVYTLLEGW